MQLSFFGATQTVTGSRYLVTCGERRVLVDCGLTDLCDRRGPGKRRCMGANGRGIEGTELGWSVTVPEYRDEVLL